MLYVCANAYIIIEIDQSELHQIAEVLLGISGVNHVRHTTSVIQKNNIIVAEIKKIALGLIKLAGITASLVAANLITTKLETDSKPSQIIHTTTTAKTMITTPASAQIKNITKIKPIEKCNYDYGCGKNICWKSCHEINESQTDQRNTWCYTTSNKTKRTHMQCIDATDCSPCWECAGQCHHGK